MVKTSEKREELKLSAEGIGKMENIVKRKERKRLEKQGELKYNKERFELNEGD